MNKEKILSDLERDSFNGQITIGEFRKRVKEYAEIHHADHQNKDLQKEVEELRAGIRDAQQEMLWGGCSYGDTAYKILKEALKTK